MARKFKIGDKVKVVKVVGTQPLKGYGFKVGSKGKIVNYWGGNIPYPYQIKNLISSCLCDFAAKELEKI